LLICYGWGDEWWGMRMINYRVNKEGRRGKGVEVLLKNRM
jgi:hypothetical protein